MLGKAEWENGVWGKVTLIHARRAGGTRLSSQHSERLRQERGMEVEEQGPQEGQI